MKSLKQARSRGFTLLEVLIAVAVLSLFAAASLKLSALSLNGLREAAKEEAFITEAKNIRAKILTGEIAPSGSKGSISWETANREKKHFGENFGKLNFEKNAAQNAAEDFKWRELTIRNAKTRQEMKIVLPAKGARTGG